MTDHWLSTFLPHYNEDNNSSWKSYNFHGQMFHMFLTGKVKIFIFDRFFIHFILWSNINLTLHFIEIKRQLQRLPRFWLLNAPKLQKVDLLYQGCFEEIYQGCTVQVVPSWCINFLSKVRCSRGRNVKYCARQNF